MTVDVNLGCLAEIVFVRFPPFPGCPLWKGVTMPSPHLSGGELHSSLLGGNIYIAYLELFCTADVSSSPLINLFSHLFVLVWTRG